ncbi:uncharacterized protein LOC117108517 isoform X2 [Anneissia japonica]|uniref:uncharacterized protein LOC117108517 isoform X2 n=1 Tax=Anneissia japonica TaxID=1529436 RepID=UPI001425B4D2|nr:uncharacterized protein LOC117108517 isoform X2 [Anneissia japonica]
MHWLMVMLILLKTGVATAVTTQAPDCLPVFKTLASGEHQIVNSSNYPVSYQHDLDCYWEFTAPENHHILLTLYDVDIESEYDYLLVGNGGDTNATIAQISGSRNPGSFRSTGNVMWLRFITDASVAYSGFHANVKAVLEYDTCGFTCRDGVCMRESFFCDMVNDCLNAEDELDCVYECEALAVISLGYAGESQSFTSPHYPDNYYNNINCQWNIRASDDLLILLEFNDFHLEFGFDFVFISSGNSSLNQFSFTGENVHSILSESSKMSVLLTTDGSVTERGFLATVKAVNRNASEAPTIVCPEDFIYGKPEHVHFNVTATDNDGAVYITCDHLSGSSFNDTTLVSCFANDTTGNSSTCNFTVIIDMKAPIINCTIDQITSFIPLVNFSQPIAVDDLSEPNVDCFPFSGSRFPIGNTTVTCTARDHVNNTATCSFVVNISSEVPDIVCPEDHVYDTPSYVHFDVTATDKEGAVYITCDHLSGSFFNDGSTLVSCVAIDITGNRVTCVFKVIIDITDPVINCTTDQITSIIPLVNYSQPIAVDDLSKPIVDCFPVSGSTFPIGYTTVECIARDHVNNTANCYFVVNVSSEAPDIVCPEDHVYDTPSYVHFDVTATDKEGAVYITCDHLSGSFFNVGSTLVSCVAIDITGNRVTCVFKVIIDITDPVINCTTDQITSIIPLVNYSQPIAVDDLSKPIVDCFPVSGSTFPIGYTTVECIARDHVNNTANCYFVVNVSSEAPDIVCPEDHVYDTPSYVHFDVTATDKEGAVYITCDHLSGSFFNVGSTLVSCVAIDITGNRVTCDFKVFIASEAPNIFCPEYYIYGTPRYVHFNVTGTDKEGPVFITCDHLSGSLFFNTTLVSCLATDITGNNATCDFKITIDSEAPTIVCPEDVAYGSPRHVNFNMTGTDKEGTINITCNHLPGSLFDDTTLVSCVAIDIAGNSATCDFKVIIDTVAPVISCQKGELKYTTPYVNYRNPTVTDDQSTNPTVSCQPESGSVFEVGDTLVECIAIDDVNNAASCSFLVKVSKYKDVFPPSITCPMDIISPSQSPDWTIPIATDDQTQSPPVECSPDPNKEYAIGSVNEVTCTTIDDAGNKALCSFTISVASETSTEIVKITEMVTDESVEDVSQELDEYLEEVDMLEPVDVVVTSVALEAITNLGSPDKNVTEAVVSIVDVVVGTTDLNVPPKTTASILDSFEDQVDVIANSGENYTQVEENIAIQTLSLDSNTIQSNVKFIVSGNATNTRVCVGNECSETVAFSVTLPKSILKASEGKGVNISFVVYTNDKLFSSNRESETNTTGTVLSATVYTDEVLPPVFEDPVELTFTAPEYPSSSTYKCAYWNETMNEFGDWSFEGCNFTGLLENRQIICECTHLTNFAVLIFPNSNPSYLSIVTYIGCSMSIIGLIITIVTVLGSKSIRSRQPQQIMVNLCFSMLFLYIVFLFGVDTARHGSNGCITVAVLLHYFLLTTIAWTAVEAANIYYLIINVFNQPTSRFMSLSLALAWGLPWIPIIIMLSVDKHFYNNDKYCYINSAEKVALIGGIVAPISIIIFGNCIVFGLVVRKIFINTQGKIADPSKNETRERLLNAVAISCLLGLTWIFGFLSFDHDGQVVFLVLFCIFNTFQGVAIFVLFCFLRKECKDVWKAWFKKCGVQKPTFLSSFLYKRSECLVDGGAEISNIGSSEFTQQTNASFNSESKF